MVLEVLSLPGFFRGDDYALQLVLTEKGTQIPVDISGWRFDAALKLSTELSDSEALDSQGNRQVLVISVTAPEGGDSEQGRVTLLFPSAQTADLVPVRYCLDVQVVSSGAVQTLFQARVPVWPDVVHRGVA